MKPQFIFILALLFVSTMSACSCGEDLPLELETDASADVNVPDVGVPDTSIPDATPVPDATVDADTPDAQRDGGFSTTLPDASLPDADVPDAQPPEQVCYHPACPWWASIDTVSPEKVFSIECYGYQANVVNTVITLDASTWYGGTGTVTVNGVTDTYTFNVTDGSRHDGASFIYNPYYDDSLTQEEADSMVSNTHFEVTPWPTTTADWFLVFSSGGFANSETEGTYLCNNK